MRLHRLFFIILLLSPHAASLRAQGVYIVRANTGGRTQVLPGAKISVPVVLDLSAAQGGNLAAVSSNMSWGSTRLTFDSVAASGFGTFTPNTTNASTGSLGLTLSSPGTTGTVTMATAYFTTSSAQGGTTIAFAPVSASNAASASLLPQLRVRPLQVCVGPTGSWGDANADNSVNIIDAQQIARFSVGLSVANAPAITAQGDVTNDASTNIIDAQQVARFSVGLTAAARINASAFTPPTVTNLSVSSVLDAAAGAMNAGVPANLSGITAGGQAQVLPLARDAGSNDVTACATISYSSSSPAVATISASGLVSAIAPGTTTITVASGSTNAAVNLTVVPSSQFAMNSWTNSSGGAWSTASNWSLARVPQSGDSVVIAQSGNYTVTLDTTFTGAFVSVGGGSAAPTLTVPGRVLTLSGSLIVQPGGSVVLQNANVIGTVSNGGTLLAAGSSTMQTLTTTPGAVTRIQGSSASANATLVVANGFTNNGTLDLTSVGGGFSAVLAVNTGTLVNAAGATITSSVGSGGSRTILSALDNQGTVTVSQQLLLSLTSQTVTSSGSIAVNAGLTVTQTGSNPAFTTSGPITIGAAQTLSFQTGFLTQTSSGSITGAGTLSLTGIGAATFAGTVSMGALVSNASNIVFNNSQSTLNAWAVTGGNLSVPTLTNPAGQTLTIQNVAVLGNVSNAGTLVAECLSSISGTLSTASGSVLTVRGSSAAGNADLSVGAGFANAGTIDLTSTGGGFSSTLTVNGTLINNAGATISASVGTGGSRTLAATVDNQGSITVNQALVLASASASHSNTGTVSLVGGDLTVSQSGTSPTFTNGGTISASAGRTLFVTGGSLIHSSGATMDGLGGVNLNSAVATFGAAPTVATVTMTSTTATFTTLMNSSATTWTFVGSTATGSALTNATGNTMTVRNSTLGLSLNNAGTLLVEGVSALNGALTTATGSTLTVRGSSVAGNATFTLNAGFANGGTVDLTSTGGAFSTSLAITNSGALTNLTGGTVLSSIGAGGPRSIQAPLINNSGGTVTINQDLTIVVSNLAYSNAGTISLVTGNLTLSQSGTANFTAGGTINVAAGRNLMVSGGTFTQSSTGSLTGAGGVALTSTTASFQVSPAVGIMTLTSVAATLAASIASPSTSWAITSSTMGGAAFTNTAGQTVALMNSTISAPMTNSGTLTVQGTSALTGGLTTGSGSTLQIQGSSAGANATLTLSGNTTNNGTIDLTSSGGGFNATLVGSGGAILTNAAGRTIQSSVGAGGLRTITASVTNNGTITVNQPLTLNPISGNHSLAGTLNINANLTLTQTGTSPVVQFAGAAVVAPTAALAVSGGTVTNTGAANWSGSGTVSFSALTANIAGVFGVSTVNMTGVTATFSSAVATSGPWTIISSPLSGATLTNSASQTMILRESSVGQAFVNNGTLIAEGTSNFTSTFAANAGSTLTVQGSSAATSATLNLTAPFANRGTLNLTSTGGGFNSTLTVPGTLINATTGVINSVVGAGGLRTIDAALNDSGAVSIAANLLLNRVSAAHIISTGGSVTTIGGNLTVQQSGAGASLSFRQASTTTIAAGDTLFITGGSASQNIDSFSADLTGNGALQFTNATFSSSGGAPSVRSIIFRNSSASFVNSPNNSDWDIFQSSVNFESNLTIPVGRTARFASATTTTITVGPGGSLTNCGTLNLEGNITVNATVTNCAGATGRARADASLAGATSTITIGSSGLTNNGTWEMTSQNGNSNLVFQSFLQMSNSSTGTLNVLAGTGGTRQLVVDGGIGTFTNSGTLDIFPLSLGNLSVSGGYRLSAGTTRMYTNCSTVSQLQISGALSFNGATPTNPLTVLTIGTCTPSSGTRTLLTYQSRTPNTVSTFSPVSTAGVGSVSYLPSSMTWTVP